MAQLKAHDRCDLEELVLEMSIEEDPEKRVELLKRVFKLMCRINGTHPTVQ